MSTRKKNMLRMGGLVLLAVATFAITNMLVGRRTHATAKASAKPEVVRQKDEIDDFHAALNASQRQPHMAHHHVVDVIPADDRGRIGLLVDVEAWHGSDIMPKVPEAMRAMRLCVAVYSPDDPQCQGNPVRLWRSDAVEIVEGLYEERISVDIPVPANVKPYQVTVGLESAVAIKHKPMAGDQAVERPFPYSGKRISFRVR